MKRFSIQFIAAALLFVFGGCATTTNPFQLSSADMKRLTPREKEMIPKGQEVEYFRDAVVYVQEKRKPNAVYDRYMKKNGPRAPFSVKYHATIKRVNNVTIRHEVSVFCVPRTENCEVTVTRSVTVLRRKPLVKPVVALFGRKGDIWIDGIRMLRNTSGTLSRVVMYLKKHLKMSKTCKVSQGMYYASRYKDVRRPLLKLLSKDGYLSYHDLENWVQVLRQEAMINAGCADDIPLEQQAKVLRKAANLRTKVGL